MGSREETIERAVLEECVREGGRVALVRVQDSKILRQGTRSETVHIATEVLAEIQGPLGAELSLKRPTSKGDKVLDEGKLYIVAAAAVPRYAPSFALRAFVSVAEGEKEAAVEAHRRILPEIGD